MRSYKLYTTELNSKEEIFDSSTIIYLSDTSGGNTANIREPLHFCN